MHQYQFLLTDTDTDTLISKISDKVADTLEQNWHGTLMLVAHMIRKSIHFVSHYILQNIECFRLLANSKLNMWFIVHAFMHDNSMLEPVLKSILGGSDVIDIILTKPYIYDQNPALKSSSKVKSHMKL